MLLAKKYKYMRRLFVSDINPMLEKDELKFISSTDFFFYLNFLSSFLVDLYYLKKRVIYRRFTKLKIEYSIIK